MNTFAPKTAVQASRLIRSTEAAAKLDACIFWNGDNTCTLDSWKIGEAGKKVKSRYELDLTAQTCTCPDFEKNGLFCKHLIYAGSIAAQEAIEEAQEALLAQMAADAANAEGVYPY